MKAQSTVMLLFLTLIVLGACRSLAQSANSFSSVNQAQPTTKIETQSNTSATPTATFEQIAKTGEKIEDFVPKEAKVIEKAEGDLNADGRTDAAIILVSKEKTTYESNGKEHQSDFYKRCLIIALRNSENKFERDALNEKILFPASDYEVANSPSNEVKISITNNILVLKQTNGLSLNKVKEYEHKLKKTDEVWKVASGRIWVADIHSGKPREIKQKQPIALDNFDIEKIESN